jgi:hypothetical protein
MGLLYVFTVAGCADSANNVYHFCVLLEVITILTSPGVLSLLFPVYILPYFHAAVDS